MIYEKPPTGDSMNALYPTLLAHVLNDGEETAPRGEATREVRPLVFKLTDPTQRWVDLSGRKANHAFALVEAFQLLDGSTDARQLVRYNSNIERWVDPETGQIEVPYGPEIAGQMVTVTNILREDPDSRRAVMTIYNGREHGRDMLNVPCTCTLQFFVRGGRLELIVYMRSNDLWWGFPYDVFQFTALQELMALKLGLPMGTYTHVAGSGHLYEPFFQKARELIMSAAGCEWEPQRPLFEGCGYSSHAVAKVHQLLQFERMLADGALTVPSLQQPFQGYLDELREYWERKQEREAARQR